MSKKTYFLPKHPPIVPPVWGEPLPPTSQRLTEMLEFMERARQEIMEDLINGGHYFGATGVPDHDKAPPGPAHQAGDVRP